VRSEGPSFHDALDPLRRIVRQRGGVFALVNTLGDHPRVLVSRSVHDFVSDIPSPFGSRFRR